MKKYLVAVAVASATLFAVSAQAVPLSSAGSGMQVSESVQKVHHCRAWSGGWGCGHSRYWSHRRWGSRGW
jgi:hypothetical protein